MIHHRRLARPGVSAHARVAGGLQCSCASKDEKQKTLDAPVSNVLLISSASELFDVLVPSDCEHKDFLPMAGNSVGPQSASDVLDSDVAFQITLASK
jgi:hypothetical protein